MHPTLNPEVDKFLLEGCYRCPKGGTPECKVHTWAAELRALREIALASGLTEDLKWKQPCYTHKGKNVLIVSAFKHFATMSFFKGALLNDPAGVLVAPGPNTQSSRSYRCTDLAQIEEHRQQLAQWIQEAILLEDSGAEVTIERKPQEIPSELSARFAAEPELEKAFHALTPGRQRAYLMHFSEAKRSATRSARIEKCAPMILAGVGLHDHYRNNC